MFTTTIRGQGKPFFQLWQNTDISYDSLLGVSLTLSDKTPINISVFLSKYSKINNVLTVSFDIEIDGKYKVLTHQVQTLTSGIQVVNLEPSEYLLSGNITVIDTDVDEYSDQMVEISPLYIYKVPIEINTDTLNIEGNELPVNSTNFIIPDTVGSCNFTADTAHITLSVQSMPPTIDDNQNLYITSFAGKTIDENGTGVLKLPSDFKVTKISDTFALIQPYTYDTCKTSAYKYEDLGNVDCTVAKGESYELPLDVCFDDDYILKPERVESMVALDGVNYLALNGKH